MQVFELRNSHASQLAHISAAAQYMSLKAAGVKVERGTTRPGGHAAGSPAQQQPAFGPSLLADGKLFLEANESVVLAFTYRLLQLPATHQHKPHASHSTAGGGPAVLSASSSSSGAPDHVVTLQLSTQGSDSPLSIVELAVHPQPVHLRRTFRLDAPEDAPFRTCISIAALPDACSAFSPAALQSLSACCGAAGAAAAVARDASQGPEVVVRCKAGPAPSCEQLCVVLYSDMLMTRVVEVWQVLVQAVRAVGITAPAGQVAKVSMWP